MRRITAASLKNFSHGGLIPFSQRAMQQVGDLERCRCSSLPGNDAQRGACPIGVSYPVVVHRRGVQSRCIDLRGKQAHVTKYWSSPDAAEKHSRYSSFFGRELTCFAAAKRMFCTDGIPEALRVALAEEWNETLQCFVPQKKIRHDPRQSNEQVKTNKSAKGFSSFAGGATYQKQLCPH